MTPLFESLKKFFEESPLAVQAAGSLKEGRVIQLHVVDGSTTHHFAFCKSGGKNQLEEKNVLDADMIFTVPKTVAEELVVRGFGSIPEIGLFIFEKMLSSDPAHKVKAKVQCGIFTILTGGYLGILSAGGADVAKYLASKGLSNPGKIKDAITKLRG